MRIRLALGVLTAANALCVPLSKSLIQFCETCWAGLESDPFDLRRAYVCFDAIHIGYTELSEPEVPTGKVIFLGAYSVLWELYQREVKRGQIAPKDFPSEMREGDVGLWREFADALEDLPCFHLSDLPSRIRSAIQILNSPDSDEDVILSRQEINDLLGATA